MPKRGCGHIKAVATVLLAVLLCLTVSGPVYVSTYLSMDDAHHSGVVCGHVDASGDHDSQDGHEQIGDCHVLDAPCELPSHFVVKHAPQVEVLMSSYCGRMLQGYDRPPEIPPKRHV